MSLRHVPTSRPPGPPAPGSEPLEPLGRPEPPATRCTYAVHASLRRVGPARGATPPSQPALVLCGPTTTTSITTRRLQKAGFTKDWELSIPGEDRLEEEDKDLRFQCTSSPDDPSPKPNCFSEGLRVAGGSSGNVRRSCHSLEHPILGPTYGLSHKPMGLDTSASRV